VYKREHKGIERPSSTIVAARRVRLAKGSRRVRARGVNSRVCLQPVRPLVSTTSEASANSSPEPRDAGIWQTFVMATRPAAPPRPMGIALSTPFPHRCSRVSESHRGPSKRDGFVHDGLCECERWA